MAKKQQESSLVHAPQVSAAIEQTMPDYIKNAQVHGVDLMKQYVVFPRIKVVQKGAAREVLDKASVGSVVLLPDFQNISENAIQGKGLPADQSTDFHGVVLFFFPSWGQRNAYALRGKPNEPNWHYQTNDPEDPFVLKCKNPSLRKEKHPRDPSMEVRNIELLNFVLLLEDPGDPSIKMMPIMYVAMKGEFRPAANFLGNIAKTKASCFARRWKIHSKFRPGNGSGDWFGLDFEVPASNPWVTSESYQRLEKMHGDIADIFKKRGIGAADDEDDLPENTGAQPVDTNPRTSTY